MSDMICAEGEGRRGWNRLKVFSGVGWGVLRKEAVDRDAGCGYGLCYVYTIGIDSQWNGMMLIYPRFPSGSK